MADKNWRVMECLQHPGYDDETWSSPVSPMDSKFIEYVGSCATDVNLVSLADFEQSSTPGPCACARRT